MANDALSAYMDKLIEGKRSQIPIRVHVLVEDPSGTIWSFSGPGTLDEVIKEGYASPSLTSVVALINKFAEEDKLQ